MGKFDIKDGGVADDETVANPHNPVLASIAAVYLVPTTSIFAEAASISFSSAAVSSIPAASMFSVNPALTQPKNRLVADLPTQFGYNQIFR